MPGQGSASALPAALQNPALGQGLIGFGQSLAQAGAPSPYKQSFAGGLAQGAGGFAQGLEQYKAQQVQDQQLELQRQEAEQRNKKLGLEAQKMEDERKANEAKQNTLMNMAKTPPKTWGGDMQSWQNLVLTDPDSAAKWYEPKELKSITQYQGGQQRNAFVDPLSGEVVRTEEWAPRWQAQMQEAKIPGLITLNKGGQQQTLRENDPQIDKLLGEGWNEGRIPAMTGQEFKQENSLRDEFNALTKDFRTVQDAYSKISSTSDTGAGDMSMLYNLIKLYDPGSVVRESEFAMAAQAGSFGERIQGAVGKLVTGERLPPSLRAEFKAEAQNLYNAQKQGYDRISGTYKGMAEQYGIDPNKVVWSYDTPANAGAALPTAAPAAPQPAAPQAAASAPPKVGEVRKGYMYKGGDPADPESWAKVPQSGRVQ